GAGVLRATSSRSRGSAGIRPALVCGAASRPRYSISLSTERIEAGDRLIPAYASVLEPTGWPLSMYPSTTRRKIARARSVSSETGGEVMTAAYLVARGAAG